MAYFMTIREGGQPPSFEWEDKSGYYADKDTPLPFSKWTASEKITDLSNIPTVAIQTDKAPLTDAFWISDAGVISERFKNIIEGFEPDHHQFFPVTLKRGDGSPYLERYYIFHPTGYAPCVLLSKSGIADRIRVRFGPRLGMPCSFVHEDEYVISKNAYGDRKVFDSLYVNNQGLLIADDVMARIKSEDIQILRVHKVKEVDESWVFENEDPDLAAYLEEHSELRQEFRLEAF